VDDDTDGQVTAQRNGRRHGLPPTTRLISARLFAAEEDEEDEHPDDLLKDDEDPAVLACDAEDAAEAQGSEAPRLIAAAERAAKYAATLTRQTAGNAGEAAAEGAGPAVEEDMGSAFRRLMNIGFRATRAGVRVAERAASGTRGIGL